jgi:nucleolin
MPADAKESDDSGIDWPKAIKSVLKSSDVRQVKKLRKMVLLSLQMDESDKASKKKFKQTIQTLEADGTISLDSEGNVAVSKKKRKSEDEEKSKKKKKRRKDSAEETNNDESQADTATGESDNNPQDKEIMGNDDESSSKNKPVKGNPQGVTRLFLGNLPFSVDESSLGAFLPGVVTHIKWITDKETGKFYGSAFIEMDTSKSSAEAVAMAGTDLIGRPIKINFAPSREGEIWPPEKKVVSGGGQAGGSGVKAMSAKPENCLKLFIGNLSYEIDDDAITKFFAAVDAELKAVRWLHHKDSGDFKGVGYAEFWNTEACEKGAALNGKNLLGRPIRIDWTE